MGGRPRKVLWRAFERKSEVVTHLKAFIARTLSLRRAITLSRFHVSGADHVRYRVEKPEQCQDDRHTVPTAASFVRCLQSVRARSAVRRQCVGWAAGDLRRVCRRERRRRLRQCFFVSVGRAGVVREE